MTNPTNFRILSLSYGFIGVLSITGLLFKALHSIHF